MEERLSAVGAARIRVHGDCHHGNILWTDAGPHFVDLDDCRNGPAVQDLWMLLNGERSEQTVQLDAMLEGYRLFRDLDLRELALDFHHENGGHVYDYYLDTRAGPIQTGDKGKYGVWRTWQQTACNTSNEDTF